MKIYKITNYKVILIYENKNLKKWSQKFNNKIQNSNKMINYNKNNIYK